MGPIQSLKRYAPLAIVAGVAFTFSSFAVAADMEGAIARGAKLYDKWFAVTKAEKPTETHKAWPASNTKKKGNTTWRCKSCHGWDYMGKDGAYGSGSYKTGIPGISAFAGADIAKIVAVLNNDTHGLAGKMADQDFRDLALFVSQGQVDMDTYIDRAGKAPKGGDAAKGASYYNTLCAQCHGDDGMLPKDMEKPLGGLMGNPWEVMHKILNGQPGEQMPALRALDRQVVVDIMAHLTTLPKKK
jgi:thiosulfate dehydrogenase